MLHWFLVDFGLQLGSPGGDNESPFSVFCRSWGPAGPETLPKSPLYRCWLIVERLLIDFWLFFDWLLINFGWFLIDLLIEFLIVCPSHFGTKINPKLFQNQSKIPSKIDEQIKGTAADWAEGHWINQNKCPDPSARRRAKVWPLLFLLQIHESP